MHTPTTGYSHSPFYVSDEHARNVNANRGFQVVQQFLASQSSYNSFCSEHSTLNPTAKEIFFHHRTIIHALLLPLLQIHTQASTLSATLLQTSNQASLELAFRGASRGAFSWLQCFVTEEENWCATRGCPACVTIHTLSTEPTIRVMVVASRLSETLQRLFAEAYGGEEAGPSLPGFGFWEHCLKQAVARDEFWGMEYWEDIEVRARDLEQGVRELMDECCRPTLYPRVTDTRKSRRAVSGFARKQLSMVKEEQEWMRRVIMACWSTLLTEAARERRRVSATKRPMPPPRTRSLTT